MIVVQTAGTPIGWARREQHESVQQTGHQHSRRTGVRQSASPVTTKNGMAIGGGLVYPEVNFTLPPLDINADTMPTVREQYTNMIDEICRRAVELQVPGLVVEFELLPPMTLVPEWGAEITAILRATLNRYAESDGLTSALRVTPNDIREYERPPMLREGHLWQKMARSFELNAQAGADFLSIESTGGKEVHDDATIMCDLPGALFSLGVRAVET